MNATTFTFGSTSDILKDFQALEGSEVELTVERAPRQVITSNTLDETVVTYQERSETFRGLLWGARISGGCVHVCIGARKAFVRGENPICAPQGYILRAAGQ